MAIRSCPNSCPPSTEPSNALTVAFFSVPVTEREANFLRVILPSVFAKGATATFPVNTFLVALKNSDAEVLKNLFVPRMFLNMLSNMIPLER